MPKTEMDLGFTQIALRAPLDEIHDIVQKLPDKGDTEETSQKITLLNAVNKLYMCINGLTVEDLNGEEES